ncbi:hypothetical protein CSKR_109731 [Clonorchis sinensis]|uniref:Uncharacterized protein n=1 Tax=Clonorchis sinensis TaxID=79923 RepID=A0A419PF66_CLOSI|nr:hypothetical protein CSKR_109731 [Clonorchis sinensis]
MQANATKRLRQSRNRSHFLRDAKQIYEKTYYSHASSVVSNVTSSIHKLEPGSVVADKRGYKVRQWDRIDICQSTVCSMSSQDGMCIPPNATDSLISGFGEDSSVVTLNQTKSCYQLIRNALVIDDKQPRLT